VNVTGKREFDAPREAVWSVLMDPAKLAKLMPGVEGFDIKDDAHWAARVRVPLGMGGLKLTIEFEKLDERPPEHAALRAKGKGVGAIVEMKTRFDLSEKDGTTSMDWLADVRVLGQVGAMGQRVLQPIVNHQVADVLAALDREVQAAAATGAEAGIHPASPEAYSTNPDAPTQSTES
jgi:carbon monoxide dehydrogenase subunit G